MKKILAATLALTIALSGCATSSGKVAATYASPLAYQSYDCTQIASESNRLQSRMTELGGQVDKAADNDKVLTGVAVVLFWPAIFFLGNKQQEAEFGRIKGEYEAVQQSAIAKKCV
jgi:hypothetical protein